MVDEAKWKRRLLLLTLVRLTALGIVFLGIAIAYFDLVRPGGWPQLGAIVIVLGALDALFAPLLLRRHWRAEDDKE